ncbi:MAG: hypothetical protein O7A09_12640 [Proteobacteria bacterium]|nr:hypothetical protein [Pseudomonadota bacterium]
MSAAREDYEVQALGLLEILGVSFRILFERFAVLAGLGLVANLPAIAMFTAFVADSRPGPGDAAAQILAPDFLNAVAGYAVATCLAIPFVGAAVAVVVSRLYLGHTLSFGDAAREGLSHYAGLALSYGVLAVVSVAVAGILAVLVFGGTAIAQGLGGMGELLGFALAAGAIAVGLNLALVWFLLPQVVVLEGESVFHAVARVWTLLDGMRWKAASALLSGYLIVAIPSTVLQFSMAAVPLLGIAAWSAVQAIGHAFIATISVVLYLDIRARKEAFDRSGLAGAI